MSKTKEITLDSFKKLLKNNLWEHKVFYGKKIEENDDSIIEWTGWVECISSLDDIDIHHYLEFSYIDDDLNSFEYSYEELDKPEWVVNGIKVLDENGEFEIEEWGLYSELFDKFNINEQISLERLTESNLYSESLLNRHSDKSLNEWHTIVNGNVSLAFNGHKLASKIIINRDPYAQLIDDEFLLASIYQTDGGYYFDPQYIVEHYSSTSSKETLGSVCYDEEQVRLFFSKLKIPEETIDILCAEAGF